MHSWYHAGIALFTQHAVKKICIHTICYFEIKHTWTQIKYFNSCYFFIFSVPQVWNLHKTGLIFTLNRGNVIVQLSGRKKSNNPSLFSTTFKFFQTTHAPWRMLKAPPCYSSDVHLSVFQNRPNRGALLCSKICLKKF